MGALDRFFKLREHGTSVRIEVIAGITTFMTMAYIIFVQPFVLSAAGMDAGAVMVATCLSAAIATILMGLWARYPIALAPGMGENFFFAFTVVLVMGMSWQKALAAVFVAGVIFLILSFLKVRQALVEAIPDSVKHSIGAGIGIFIAFIGLTKMGLVVRNDAPDAFLMLGPLKEMPVYLGIIGLILTIAMMVRKVKGSILIGIIFTYALFLVFNLVSFTAPDGGQLVSAPPSLAPVLFKFDFSALFTLEFLMVVIIFLFMDLFDTTGTLIAVAGQAGFLKDGKLERATPAFASDAIGTVAGACMGTSTVTSYIESAAGVESGGRTGLTSVVTGILFLLAMFFAPIVKTIGGGVLICVGMNQTTCNINPILGPALVAVGAMMAGALRRVNWDDYTVSIPAFLILVGIPLTYSITDGLGFGFVALAILKLVKHDPDKPRPWLIYFLGFLFILRFAFLPLT